MTSSATDPTVSEYHPSSGDVKEEMEECDTHLKRKALSMTNYFISCDSKRYIGIPTDWLWILDHLHREICMSTDDIKLTLLKIRLNDTFVRLGDQFGISSTQASKVFNNCVIKLANVLKTLIYFSDKESVKRALPIPFRANYSDVRSIIDAFEIQIEKPSNPVHQALTWSEYKKCNTIKYLISCSPDGKINFISKGYGGRISDCVLFEMCGIMDELPKNCAVMADRGFKQIETVLSKKNCRLVRPPSVSSNVKPSKLQVLETKRIASLRIHIERVIRRIREFKMLVPHACTNHFIIPIIDHAVIICAGLINIQTPIIRT
ncbi:uncharacterized protein [Temnothorax nylanderi]|uniref:uncharacterized protein n=1 Tax=Temnothorax nylanderi TaxID=102681 RepID=UPI003A882F8A